MTARHIGVFSSPILTVPVMKLLPYTQDPPYTQTVLDGVGCGFGLGGCGCGSWAGGSGRTDKYGRPVSTPVAPSPRAARPLAGLSGSGVADVLTSFGKGISDLLGSKVRTEAAAGAEAAVQPYVYASLGVSTLAIIVGGTALYFALRARKK